MWVETQDGELVNVDYVVHIGAKNRNGKYQIYAEFADGGNIEVGEYNSEESKTVALEEFVQKIRRTGARIFKFKKEC